MGKQSGKKKKHSGDNSNKPNVNQSKDGGSNQGTYDEDTARLISRSHEMRGEGSMLFQKRDYEGALLRFGKALRLLPVRHLDVASLRSNMAECHMQMGLGEYPRAIQECNLALEADPKYSKALLKRGRCYEALDRLDLALRDVHLVLIMEPKNLMAAEILEELKKGVEKKGPIRVEPPCASHLHKAREENRDGKSDKFEEKRTEDKVVVEEKVNNSKEEEPKKTVKLVFGEDIRWAQLPANCSLLQLREVIRDRFPCSKAVLVKFKDPEGDLVTVTTNEELKWAEASADPQGSYRLHIVEVAPEQDPLYMTFKNGEELGQKTDAKQGNVIEKRKGSTYIDDWIIGFAQLFENQVGLEDNKACMDFQEFGMELYCEVMEETVTSDEAQGLFHMAAESFQEMGALALFNWGNVHMSQARRLASFTKGGGRESMLATDKSAYDLAQNEYLKARRLYEEAVRTKPDFYEGLMALGQLQFEQARLSWYYAIGSNLELETRTSTEVLQLYNSAENNMERGMKMWEEVDQQRQSKLSQTRKIRSQLEKMGLGKIFTDIPLEEAIEQAINMRSQIHLVWGAMLYERSLVEFKLEIPRWRVRLESAVEKFELAGASQTHIAIMIKNHCYNESTNEDFVFKFDEKEQAWDEMHEAERWQSSVSSFRLEPLFRRHVSQLCHVMENSRIICN